MAKENLLLIITDKDYVLFSEMALSQKGFNVSKLSDCKNLLNIVSTEKPDLIVIDQDEIDTQDGYEVLKEIKSQHPSLPVIIKCHWRFKLATDIRKFMQAGVYDYLPFPFSPSDLIESVNNALMAKNDLTFSGSPIVEKLLVQIEGLQQSNYKLTERYEWYEKNRQKLACDCLDQIKQGAATYDKPKTTSFRKLGRASDGYYIGFKFICDVCKTAWFCGESHTESEFHYFWEPADENVDLVELDSRHYPKESDDYEPL